MPLVSVRMAIAIVFFLSGATGLVWQVLWTRQLSLVFGVTTYAVATVLATFMGGLALGSFLFGRWVDRSRNPVLAYALLEAGIGIYALFVPYLFEVLRGYYVVLRQLELSYGTLALLRALLAALVLLPPTTLMGGTLPVLTRYWVRVRGEVGLGAGLLYFTNTAGAIAGCLVGGFYLLARFGLSGTTYVTAVANLAIAALALLLARGAGARAAEPAAASAEQGFQDVSPTVVRLVLVSIGLSGFAALAYEVLWTRALLRYLYNSTYAFTTMLATFLAGIAIGSALYTALLRRSRRPVRVFVVLQALVGLTFVVSAILFPHVMDVSAALAGSEIVESFGGAVRMMFLRAMLILLPPAICLGATVPLAIALCARELTTLGHTVGRVYAVNTFGAILGSLAAAFVLIPALGMQGTLAFLVTLNLVAAGMVAVAAQPSTGGRLKRGVGLAVVAVLAVAAIPEDIFKRTFPLPGHKLVYYEEGATDTVGVIEAWGHRSIQYDDRRGTAGTLSFPYNFFFGHLPMLLHPGEPRRVLHICFGAGNSLSAVAAHDSVERVDNVELSPHVLQAARYFWTNNNVIEHPKVRTIIDDGRNFVMSTRETYDVITLEPPEIFTSGVINLYTRDFYRDALERLAPDGIMIQWLPSGEAPLADERMLFRAFADVFPYVTAWLQLESPCLVLVGSRQPIRIDYQRLQEKMQRHRVRRDLELSGIRNVDHLLAHFAFDEAAFAEFVRDVPPTTDDRTILDFTMPHYLGSGFGLGILTHQKVRQDGKVPFSIAGERKQYYVQNRRSVVPYVTNLGDETPAALASRIEAQWAIPIKHRSFTEKDWQRW
jgi:spermidine synthase